MSAGLGDSEVERKAKELYQLLNRSEWRSDLQQTQSQISVQAESPLQKEREKETARQMASPDFKAFLANLESAYQGDVTRAMDACATSASASSGAEDKEDNGQMPSSPPASRMYGGLDNHAPRRL